MTTLEYNFDGLVGPTHNYAGLAHGNLASQTNRQQVSHPRRAALEGLAKMKLLADLGIPQAVLPPQERPDIQVLRRLGFTGTDAAILARAAQDAPEILAACSSASSMWSANAATVSPSPDTADGLLHLTPANLMNHLHRSLETPATARLLQTLFPGPLFAHHPALPATPAFADEGAANHSRLCAGDAGPGIELFVYGDDPTQPQNHPARFTPRHSRLASEAIARSHRLDPRHTFFARQHPAAVDAGVFHNDVISLAHHNIFLYHEKAFVDAPILIAALGEAFTRLTGNALQTVCIPEALLPLPDAVKSYLFNSQLVTGRDGKKILIAPIECQQLKTAAAALDFIREKTPTIAEVKYSDVRQSMRNGGGPACLRLRIVLTPDQQNALHPAVLLTGDLHQHLHAWITRHYREDLRPADLADPHLLTESRTALDALTHLLRLPNLYPFQTPTFKDRRPIP